VTEVEVNEPRDCRIRWHLPLLLALTCGLSLRLYLNTAAVGEDTANFVQYARQLNAENPASDYETWLLPRAPIAAAAIATLTDHVPGLDVAVRREQHPGYPLLILAMHHSIGGCLAADPIWQWIRAGQLVSLLAGLLLTTALYLLGRRLLDSTSAFVGCLVFVLMPACATIRVDALSDTSALALLVLSAFFACRLLEMGGMRNALACGLAGALAYLVRPEAIQVVGVTAALLVLRALVLGWRALSVGQTFLSASAEADRNVCPTPPRHPALLLGALLVPVIAICLPYIFLRGSFLTKQARVFTPAADPVVQPVRGLLAPGEQSKPLAAPSPASLHLPAPILTAARGLRRFTERWRECIGGLFLLGVIVGMLVRRRDFVSRPPHRLIALLLAFNVTLLAGLLFSQKGYIDWRHLLPTTALSIFWLWPGLRAVAEWLTVPLVRMIPSRFSPQWQALVPGGVACMLLVVGLAPAFAFAVSPTLHGESTGYLRAGCWLRAHADCHENIIDPEKLTCFFADRDECRRWDYSAQTLAGDRLDRILAAYEPAQYLVLSDHYLRDHGLPGGLPEHTARFAITPAAAFPTTQTPGDPACIRIYRIHRD
jgi:hypothetical protein